MENTKIGSVAAVFLVLTVIINHIALSFPKNILDFNGSGTFINLIYISIIAIFIVLLICNLLKRFPGNDILDVSSFLFGKTFKFIIGLLFIVYIILTCSYLIRDFCEGLKIIYFTRTNVFYILALFMITICIVVKLGDKAVINSNLLILPIALFSIILILIANIKNLVPQRIFPIFGYGINKTFIQGIQNLYSFGNIGILYFLPSYLKDITKLKKISLIAIFISSFYLIITLTGLFIMFPFTISSNETMPLYLASRFIEFGNFFQRIDSIFLLIWIWTMILHLSILLIICIKIITKISIIKNRNIIVYTICILIFVISLIPKNLVEINFFELNIYKYMVLFFILGGGICILIFANVKRKINEFHKKIYNKRGVNFYCK